MVSSKFKKIIVILSQFQCMVPHSSDPDIGKCCGEKEAKISSWDLASNQKRTARWPHFFHLQKRSHPGTTTSHQLLVDSLFQRPGPVVLKLE